MAPRLQKRTLELADFKSPQRLQEVFNPLLESYSALLAGGVSLDNLRAITVTAKVKPPDEWTPLELVGATAYANPAFGAPAVRWNAGTTEYRGLLNRAAGGASTTSPFARIPDTAASLRPAITTPLATLVQPYAPGAVEISTAGAISLAAPSGFTGGNWVSLTGLQHPSTPSPPPWAAPVDITLAGANGVDYGVPTIVLTLSAVRKDRVLVTPDVFPVWETPSVGNLGKRERKLRIRRLGGLAPGVEHDVTFLALYP